MTISDSSESQGFPDEVPVADAVEQTRPAVATEETAANDLEAAGAAPLESNESDWQEQQKVVGGFDEDDFR